MGGQIGRISDCHNLLVYEIGILYEGDRTGQEFGDRSSKEIPRLCSVLLVQH